MAREIRDIGGFVYQHFDFSHSEREPTSADSVIIYEGVYYYRWRGTSIEEGIDIVTQPDNYQASTAKLFRISAKQLFAKVDLLKERPFAEGHHIIDVLNE
ncbi:hypothetical protein HYT52_00085 [Candidatus Woesearchaeota archaeon]|nr:hypothetical protein [Candidatus Woesearchaeota archaeon]